MSKAGKSQLIYLLRILEHCGKIHVYMTGFDNFSDFFKKNEQLYFNATLTLLVQIGEQSVKVEEMIKSQSPEIPWQLIKGFRNIAVHEYQFVDAEKVFQICTVHIPFLEEKIELFIKQAVEKNLLSVFELQLSKGSEFYSHVNFERLIPK